MKKILLTSLSFVLISLSALAQDKGAAKRAAKQVSKTEAAVLIAGSAEARIAEKQKYIQAANAAKAPGSSSEKISKDAALKADTKKID